MTSTALLPPSIAKEVRALALPWIACLACLACMVVPSIASAPFFLGGLAVPAYLVATAALGSLSMGHEYGGRTLSLLFSLPAARSRLLANKLAVLATMQLALGGVAYTLVLGDPRLPQTAREAAAIVPALCGLFVAPWLTMACRSAIGGAVFALAIPGTLLVVGELIGTAVYGQGSDMEMFRLIFVWVGTLAVCLVGAVMGWLAFMRLEVIEGPVDHVNFARLFGGSTLEGSGNQMTRRTPIVLLVQKELHLQQLPLAVAVIFVLMSIVATWGTRWAANPVHGSAIFALTALYGGLLPLIIGASASAGERQMGTLEWQVTQPISTSTQWWIKVGVVLGLSMALALGLPMLLMKLGDLTSVAGTGPFMRRDWWVVTFVMLLASGSLYVSSLSSTALWALVMSVPATVAVATFLQFLWFRVGSETFSIARRLAVQLTAPRSLGSPDTPLWVFNALTWLFVAGFIAIALRFALENHRSADRVPRRVWVQLLVLAAFATCGVVCTSTTAAFLVAMNRLE